MNQKDANIMNCGAEAVVRIDAAFNKRYDSAAAIGLIEQAEAFLSEMKRLMGSSQGTEPPSPVMPSPPKRKAPKEDSGV